MIAQDEAFYFKRLLMVDNQLKIRGIEDKRLINAMQNIPRHLFVPENVKDQAYNNTPLPIGYKQTISQPYIVGFMTQALELQPDYKVLEIGTGSGYQTAILGDMCREVYSIEIIKELAINAKKTLKKLGYNNIHIKVVDGHNGWPEKAPFDAIILTAADSNVPETLLAQLKVGGQLILPLKDNNGSQNLVLITKIDTHNNIVQKELLPVIFVPMTSHNHY